jgi:hypothetical protein
VTRSDDLTAAERISRVVIVVIVEGKKAEVNVKNVKKFYFLKHKVRNRPSD